MERTRIIALLALFAGLSAWLGCATAPPEAKMNLDSHTEHGWRTALSTAASGEAEGQQHRWWENFHDERLNQLAGQLLSSNVDLAIARERVAEAQARRGVARAQRLPQLSAQAAYTRTEKESLDVGIPLISLGERGGDLFAASTPASWELDLWGRIAAQEAAADAQIATSIEDYRNAAMSLVAELALAYMDARVLEERLSVLQRNIEIQKRRLALETAKLSAGTGTALAVTQLRRLVDQTQARVPELERANTAAQNRIAVLLGRAPANFTFESGPVPELPSPPAMGLPAQLLTRRADIRAAERRYASSLATVAAAQAERYPRLVLNGSLDVSSREVSGLFDGVLTYSIGPRLSVPLFTGGRIASAIAQRESQSEQARLAMEMALLRAIGEVESAAVGITRAREQIAALENAGEATRESVHLAEELYDAGLGSQIEALDARRQLVEVEDSLWLARQAALGRTIQLYRALGGGWEILTLDGDAHTPEIDGLRQEGTEKTE